MFERLSVAWPLPADFGRRSKPKSVRRASCRRLASSRKFLHRSSHFGPLNKLNKFTLSTHPRLRGLQSWLESRVSNFENRYRYQYQFQIFANSKKRATCDFWSKGRADKETSSTGSRFGSHRKPSEAFGSFRKPSEALQSIGKSWGSFVCATRSTV